MKKRKKKNNVVRERASNNPLEMNIYPREFPFGEFSGEERTLIYPGQGRIDGQVSFFLAIDLKKKNLG